MCFGVDEDVVQYQGMCSADYKIMMRYVPLGSKKTTGPVVKVNIVHSGFIVSYARG